MVLAAMVCTTNLLAQNKNGNDTLLLQPIEIRAVRASDKAPFTKTNLSASELAKNNSGQDLPFLLNQTPSVVVNSDAGNGIGYTGIRIRGTDGTRINVTLNGIPYNDAESQISYFVDLPDISSSANSIQIQRGVGTSSNGAGSFGATINLSTNDINEKSYAEVNNSFGSFNSWKHTLKFGSGLLAHHFTIDGRVSQLSSNGYVDRATSDLRSFYFSAAYVSGSNSLRANIFSGKEKTYQSWYGIPQSYLDTNRTYNAAGTEKPGSPYSNETDNYTQTHYQLFFNHKINQNWKANAAFFLTRGLGYYEEYRADQKFIDYGLPDFSNGNDIVTETDLVRQLWLDNYFYGGIFSFQKETTNSQFTVGGGWNKYDGKHFGKVTWAKAGFPANYQFYNVTANKQDATIYSKLQHKLGLHWQGFEDFQIRSVQYEINGFSDNPALTINKKYVFINPKAGISFNRNKYQAYLSYSVASKEPNRDDFEAGKNQLPKPETLHDIELGVSKKMLKNTLGVTFYYMYYHDQLVLTGKINDVGSYTRTNTPSSYRMGIELQGQISLTTWLTAAANLTLSKNKIKDFTEYVDDYDNGGQQTFQYHNSNISFSPGVIAAGNVAIVPQKNTTITLLSKYVGRQYLDNSSKESRSLSGFYVQDLRLSYDLPGKHIKNVALSFEVKNIFDKKYEPNGYTFSYFYAGSLATENYYYPMAGRNFVSSLNIRL